MKSAFARWRAAVALLALHGLLTAQGTDAVLTGIVTDSSGAAIPNAVVAAINAATGVRREVVTNETGIYRIGPLVPGTYEVRTSVTGFKSSTQQNVLLQTGAVLKVDITLEVGNVNESINVEATAPMLQTQETSVGSVITTQQLERIPVNGRNYTRLLVLMPGTSDVRRSQGRGDLSGTQMVSINGQRTQDNNYQLDGADNNMMFMNSPGGSPPMDAIQEFRVATGNSAEYGRSAGANVNLSIKSGSRNLHGSLYEYLRNDKLDANTFFANRQGQGKIPFRQNQYGVAVGGPVVLPKIFDGRDSTFWFFSWEGFRWRRGQTTQNTVPTAAMRNGDFSGLGTIYDPQTGQPFANNIIPANRINPSSRVLLDKLMPLPNRPGMVNNLLQTEGQQNNRDMFVLRMDHTFGPKDTIWGRMLRQGVTEIIPAGSTLFVTTNQYDVQNYAAGWNHVFAANAVLEARYAFNNPHNPGCPAFRNGLTREGILSEAGISIFDPQALCGTMPNFSAQGYLTMGGGGGETINERVHQWNGKLTWVLGRHSVKFGGGYNWRSLDAQYSNPTNGDMTFWSSLTGNAAGQGGNSIATLLLGYPSYVRRGFGIAALHALQPHWEGFVQDDWRATEKLTVNIGLRWESGIRPWDANDALGNLLVGRDANGNYTAELMWAGVNPLPDPKTGQVNSPARTLGYGRSLMRNDMNNWAPRLGLAYQMTRNTVLRAGIGMFYNTTYMQEINDLRKFWPYLPQQEISPNTGGVLNLRMNDAGPGFGSTQAIGGWPQNPDNRSPYSTQYNFFIQQQLMDDLAIDVGYVGSANRKQIGYHGWNNAVTPGPGPVDPRRLLAGAGFVGNMSGGSNKFNSEYNAFQAKVTKRFGAGLQLLGNYTWGKCMDDQSSLAEGKFQDFLNARADWSRCSYDIKHAFKLGYVYDLPWGRGRMFGGSWNGFVDAVLGGWSIEGIVQLQSGTPSNVRTGTDRANVGATNERPDVVRNPNLPVEERTVDRWFDTGAFVMPALYTFGNAGAYIVEDDGRRIWDVSIAKKFRIREGHSLELRGEFFNFPNLVNFTAPGSGGYVMNTPTFGVITGTTPARQIQVALRYMF